MARGNLANFLRKFNKASRVHERNFKMQTPTRCQFDKIG